SCYRVPLEGAGAALSREELEIAVLALYAGPQPSRAPCAACAKWDRAGTADGDLDIINGDNTGSELADTRLVFRLESGCGAAYGFRTALELPCHRLVLAARSRFFRSVMSRRGSGSGGASGGAAGPGGAVGAWCVDEKVLPRRFARALLHAAYTDSVDLSLIGRSSSSPSSTNSTSSGATAWSGVTRSGTRPVTAAMLDDAFQLYEIARFLEMPIVVQGCEDAIVEALTPDSLPHVLRWAAQPHASQWVHRQAMRYLRDEFPAIMSGAGCGRVVRRGIIPAVGGEGAGTADAWLARGSYRPPRCFLPYLDEIKDQAVPEAELARARRERYLNRIPDTLY
ncbi:hypothetical protein HW555_013514, partial [Spodoptera exigua]